MYNVFKIGNKEELARIDQEYNLTDHKTILLAKRLAALAKDIDLDEAAKVILLN